MVEKLYSLPGFEHYLFPNGMETTESGAVVIDPIKVLSACFRLGSPLCALFNYLRPVKPLDVPSVDTRSNNYTSVSKKCVYHFIVAVKDELGIPEESQFGVADLYKDDTTALDKVITTVNEVITAIEHRGLFPPTRSLPVSTNRDIQNPADNRTRVIVELLETERIYTHALQDLLALGQTCHVP
eukprot:jgi/Hompol1/6351/HPOL_002031-RA